MKIEILLPDQSSVRVIDKILFCLNQGSSLGWLIDLQERIIMTFSANQQPQIKPEKDQLFVLSTLEDWQITVEDISSFLNL